MNDEFLYFELGCFLVHHEYNYGKQHLGRLLVLEIKIFVWSNIHYLFIQHSLIV